ncbi:hypothetical protein ACFSQP_06490 [Bizionia sediminis]|uniref:3-oxoacyl-ACP synthase n=1 Tax=Bizionia sediminis TaxID=1737064 RepID=A0ABW5KT00_9FLAO
MDCKTNGLFWNTKLQAIKNKINNSIKTQLYTACVAALQVKLRSVQNQISDIQEALTSETKNSAGDKHETGRAMLQLEREKVGVQLMGLQKQQNTLTKINCTHSSKTVCLGSVVYTSNHHYFIAISAGAINVNNTLFYAISPSTPMGKLLLGKEVGGRITFQGNTFTIQTIL